MWKPHRRQVVAVAAAVGLSFTAAYCATTAHAAKPRIKLLKRGKGKRQQLRYSIAPGARSVMIMETNMATRTALPGQPAIAQVLPTMVMEMRITPGEQLPRGEVRYGFTLTSAFARARPGASAQMVSPLNKALGGTRGMVGGGIIDRRGFNRDSFVKVPAGAPAQVKQTIAGMQQSMESLSSPLPAQRVGVGARWELHQDVATQGMKLKQVTTFRLVARSGQMVTLHASIKQTAKPQNIKTPMGQARLEAYKAVGTGKMVINLGSMVPTSRMTMKSSFTISAMGHKVRSGVDLEMKIFPR